MFRKLFGKKGASVDQQDEKKTKKLERAHTVDATTTEKKPAEKKPVEKKPAPKKEAPAASGGGGGGGATTGGKRRKKKKTTTKTDYCIDTSKPLEYPCTPEQIIDYHKQKSFLSANEEWLVVELNEYECLVDSEEIIKIIAKHSKFFELDPPELWEEFFEFVEDVPSYDEVINYDVWQEFRDKCYPC